MALTLPGCIANKNWVSKAWAKKWHGIYDAWVVIMKIVIVTYTLTQKRERHTYTML